MTRSGRLATVSDTFVHELSLRLLFFETRNAGSVPAETHYQDFICFISFGSAMRATGHLTTVDVKLNDMEETKPTEVLDEA